ncbi:MAG TPA: HlyD family efflux transporter periplasmic adaptor subunit [Polymorphobacter sp.]|nr:HlyD family efflux transporter periplasmic adaptor subunit [Polymorphobacter sp.]
MLLSRLKPILAIIAVAGLALAVWTWFSQRPAVSEGWLGYVEGEALYVAAPVAGTLESLDVRRGDSVAAGARLFALNPQAASADTRRLQAAIAIAESRRADLLKARQRPEEIAIIHANQAQARASVERAQHDYDRTAAINAKGFATNAQLDAARATLQAAQAALAATLAQERAATLTGRADDIAAATALIASTRAELVAQQRRDREIAPVAAAAAQVEQTFFNPGEWVPANAPVVSLLEPARIKLRFFVPEAVVAKLRPGTRVTASCDGCGAPFGATVRYVAPRAEFTPPVIYSERARSKLVFMVEAAPDGDPARLHPGLPVEIRPVR